MFLFFVFVYNSDVFVYNSDVFVYNSDVFVLFFLFPFQATSQIVGNNFVYMPKKKFLSRQNKQFKMIFIQKNFFELNLNLIFYFYSLFSNKQSNHPIISNLYKLMYTYVYKLHACINKTTKHLYRINLFMTFKTNLQAYKQKVKIKIFFLTHNFCKFQNKKQIKTTI